MSCFNRFNPALFKGTTAEIERQKDPCATATILILALANAEKKLAAIPLDRSIPSPTRK